MPIREATAYRARHGAGYTVFEHNSHGIEQELTVFVPVDEAGGEPIKLQRLKLTNASPRRRSLSVTYYVGITTYAPSTVAGGYTLRVVGGQAAVPQAPGAAPQPAAVDPYPPKPAS